MKAIDLPQFQGGLDEVLNLAAEENVVLTTSDGRQFVVAEVDDFEEEVRLVREKRELMGFLRQRSAPGKTYTLGEVRGELVLTCPG
ncbi:MAG TPA: hypothetical protein PLE19_10740 [Planctomycetota bacterium]|nr:hypothetical protein [Planctomycetota bacterium]HRR79033.1 hypothetical protein [Planctomycetota bacterium]HRT95498.1 hypothetical protein [Planctomycetota bacterium]